MLVRSMVDHQLRDDAQTAPLGLAHKRFEIAEGSVDRIDGIIIRDVIPIVLERRWIKRQQPQRRDAQVLQVIELLRQATKVTNAVRVAIEERANGYFIDDGAFVPERIKVRRRSADRFAHVGPRLTGMLARCLWGGCPTLFQTGSASAE